MAQEDKESNSLPLVNQYFSLSTDSRSNFFDDIPPSSDSSAFMRSVVASNSSNDLYQPSTNPQTNLNVLVNSESEEANAYKSTDNLGTKDEPVVCRIFSSQEIKPPKQVDTGSARDFFDLIGSHSTDGVSSTATTSSQVGFGLGISSASNSILTATNFNPGSGLEDLYITGKGTSGECERRRDAWIPSEQTRRILIAAATATPGTYFPDRDLLTMPGVILEEDMVDNVQQIVTHFLGDGEASQRKVLKMNDVTQDERGLRDLIQAECYRAAVNLTGRLLTIYGQGAGRAGHTSKHTVHSIQLWFTRISLLVKLQAFSLADAEASVWWDCDRPDLYYQFYPELYGGRLGTLIPFQFRLLLAILPSFSDRHKEALDRLHSILAVIRKMLRNLDNGRSEDGSQLELTPQDRVESKKLWLQREARVLHAIVNVSLLQKDYWLAVDVLQMLCEKEIVPTQKRSLYSVLGRVLLQLGDVMGAEKNFQMAQSLKKTQTGTFMGRTADLQELVDRGLMAVAQHAFQDAYDAFHKASLLEPANIMINKSDRAMENLHERTKMIMSKVLFNENSLLTNGNQKDSTEILNKGVKRGRNEATYTNESEEHGANTSGILMESFITDERVTEILLRDVENDTVALDEPKASTSGEEMVCFDSDNTDEDPTFEMENAMNEISSDEEEVAEQKQRRWRKSNTLLWKVNKAKEMRARCEQYLTKRGVKPAKAPKLVDCKNCRFRCAINFTEGVRKDICRDYWGLNNFGRQKDFILKYVNVVLPKRRRVDCADPNSRAVSKVYSLPKGSTVHRVCASFFEKTLCISNGPITNALKGSGAAGCFVGSDGRGKSAPANKSSDDQVMAVKNHISSFPCMKSHYVRKTSCRQYLDSKLSINKMYALYTETCIKENTKPVSSNVYRRIFCTEYNLSFFHPKKDQCLLCTKYSSADVSKKQLLEEMYNAHQLRNENCKKAKEVDKVRAQTDSSFQMVTFDLLSVLQIPSSDVSQLYYSRKLCVYNLTMYEGGGDNKAYCFCWNELNGKRGSNEIGTVLLRYIKKLPLSVSHLSLFSDTCGGQNRNHNVASVLLHAVRVTHVNIIEHKFLESGHSYMECDSMHSAIENAKRNVPVYTMSDWKQIFRSARSKRNKSKKDQYEVEELKYHDIYDLHAHSALVIKNRNIDENGDKVKWLDIKCLKYEKENPNIIFYRYDHCGDYKKIYVQGRGRRRHEYPELKKAYDQTLPISEVKKKDLIRLFSIGVIPEELQPWYMSLPTSNKFEDRLPEPSVSDESETD